MVRVRHHVPGRLSKPAQPHHDTLAYKSVFVKRQEVWSRFGQKGHVGRENMTPCIGFEEWLYCGKSYSLQCGGGYVLRPHSSPAERDQAARDLRRLSVEHSSCSLLDKHSWQVGTLKRYADGARNAGLGLANPAAADCELRQASSELRVKPGAGRGGGEVSLSRTRLDSVPDQP